MDLPIAPAAPAGLSTHSSHFPAASGTPPADWLIWAVLTAYSEALAWMEARVASIAA